MNQMLLAPFQSYGIQGAAEYRLLGQIKYYFALRKYDGKAQGKNDGNSDWK